MLKRALWVSVIFLLSACGAPATPDRDFSQAVQLAVQGTLTAEASSQAKTPTVSQLASTPLPPTPTLFIPTETSTPFPTAERTVTDVDRMNEMLTVSLIATKILPQNTSLNRYGDEAEFTFRYENKGTRAIRAFTGVTIFADLFGRPQKRLNLTYDTVIQPGEAVIDDDKMYELNQFMDDDNWLKTTDFENIKFIFEPKSILFTDGSQLGTVE